MEKKNGGRRFQTNLFVFYTYIRWCRYIKWKLIKHLPASRHTNKLPAGDSAGNDSSCHHSSSSSSNTRLESDDISDLSATIRNFHPFCLSDSHIFYSFIFFFMPAPLASDVFHCNLSGPLEGSLAAGGIYI